MLAKASRQLSIITCRAFFRKRVAAHSGHVRASFGTGFGIVSVSRRALRSKVLALRFCAATLVVADARVHAVRGLTRPAPQGPSA